MANFCFELRSGDVFLRRTGAWSMAIIAIAESESDYSDFKRVLAITPGVYLRSCRSKLVMLLFFDKLQHAISNSFG